MAVDKLLRFEDYTKEQLQELVRDTLKGHVTLGRRIQGVKLFYSGKGYADLKHDVYFYWRALYVKCVDEYDFAMAVFGDWNVYKKFYDNSAPFRKYFQPKWEEERELYQRSQAMRNVLSAVKEGDVKSAQWLEKHIISNSPKELKPEKKKKTKEVLESVQPMDEVWEDIYNNLN